MTCFIALDPGTHHTGVAVFDGDRPVLRLLLSGGNGPAEARIARLVQHLDNLYSHLLTRSQGSMRLEAAACERVSGYEDKRPAPELQVLVRSFRRWAKQHRLAWYEYHPSTVVAAVRPKGLKKQPTKQVIATGIQLLYGIDPATTDQNVLDALAVGHCHWCKQVEQQLLSS